ncbi:aspartic protease, TIGR02281 family [Teredinibacter turnerae T7901]|uniref:Aspartic protease, TIGR02281 family n=1 Tax=Teredinibacter turnerae (strain ATCC 39867 / T7901) TaxID=377629 RepID=C5BP14_TERTT|nr:TIGR02281 family clan AA aspartic protease [Teredinibacter turnerae]ACR12799.1 aspartic protease, TIGR02281 family [Teredinibacter turnerae T7901]
MSDSQPPGKRLGKGMLAIVWLLILGGLTLFFSRKEAQWYNPNTQLEGTDNGQSRTVTLERNNYHHYVASGYINGKPVTFLLDTGATMVSVPANLGRELSLQPGASYPVQTANGVVQVRATNIDALRLGPIELQNVRAALNPGMNGDEILLGMSALKTLDFAQSGRFLTLTQHLNSKN